MKTNENWVTIAKMQLKEIDVNTFTSMQIAVVAQCLKNYFEGFKNALESENERLIYQNAKQHDMLIQRDEIIEQLKNKQIGCNHKFIGLPKDMEIYGHKCFQCGLIQDTGL